MNPTSRNEHRLAMLDHGSAYQQQVAHHHINHQMLQDECRCIAQVKEPIDEH